MGSYLIYIFIFLAIISILDLIKIPKGIKLMAWCIAFVLMWIAVAFRAGHNDIQYYYEVFEAAPHRPSGNKMEIGYVYLNYIFKLFGFSSRYFLMVYAAVSIFIMFKFFYKYTPFFLIATIIYFSHVFILREMLQIRAGLAVGLSMFAIPYIHKRNLKKTTLILVGCSLIHAVAWFYFILYFLYPYFKTVKSYWIMLISSLAVGLILNMAFFLWLSKYVSVYRLEAYSMDGRFTKGLGLLNPVLIKHYIVLIIIFLNIEILESKIPYFRVLLLSYVIAASWLSAFNAFDIFAARVATIFSNVEHILIPSLLFLRNRKFIVYVGIIAYCIIAFSVNLTALIDKYFIFDSSWFLPN